MVSPLPGSSTYSSHPAARLLGFLRRLYLRLFVSSLASPLWLAVRLYLAYIWFSMGLSKFGSGFLTGDPIGQLLGLAGNGTLAVPVEAYRPVARLLVELGVTPVLSHSMPFLELAVALAFLSGVLLVPAALGASLLNLNFLLSGVGIVELDVRCLVLQLLLVFAFRSVGYLSLGGRAGRVLKGLSRGFRRRLVAQRLG